VGLFTPQQSIMSKHLFSLLMHLDPEQKKGAVLLLTSLTMMVEDGYQSISKDKVGDIDFYGFCYDAVLAASLSLRMLKMSGSFPEMPEGGEGLYFVPHADLLDSESLLSTIESQLKNLTTVSQGADKKQ